MTERDADGDEFVNGIEQVPEEPVAADETLTGDVVEEVTPEDDGGDANEPDGEGSEDEPEKGKRRSKPASERIAEITRDKHEAIRRAEAAEARLRQLEGGEQTEAAAPAELKEPDPSEYDFGEADPQYLKALAKYEVKVELAQERQFQAQEAAKHAATQRAAALDIGWKEQAEKAGERYEDFAETIAEYQEKEPCPPILAMAIAASDHGADVAYHLAKNPAENRELAALAQTDPLEAARRFGRLEARFEGKAANDAKPKAKTVTDAPVPPGERARGAGGRFETPDDTDDLEAFSTKFYAKK